MTQSPITCPQSIHQSVEPGGGGAGERSFIVFLILVNYCAQTGTNVLKISFICSKWPYMLTKINTEPFNGPKLQISI